MAIYWITEAIPMAVTALLPFALMPWLGIIKASEVAVNYLKVMARSHQKYFTSDRHRMAIRQNGFLYNTIQHSHT